MVHRSLVTRDPEKVSGAPCFTDTRVPVSALFDYLVEGDSMDEFLRNFPTVSREHAVAVLREAFDRISKDASEPVLHAAVRAR